MDNSRSKREISSAATAVYSIEHLYSYKLLARREDLRFSSLKESPKEPPGTV